jgi:glycosyltransferase involved in cell wall biosynthesis
MKVCFVSYEFPPKILGGAGTYAELLVKGLSQIGVEIFVVAAGEKNVREEKIYRLNVPDKAYLRQLLFMNLASKTLRTLRRELDFDLVHYNEPHIVRKGNVDLPTISTVHSSQLNEINTMLRFAGSTLTTGEGLLDLAVRSPIGYLGDILTAHTSDVIISPSQNLANLFSSHCFVDRRKIRFIPNAVDLERFDGAKTDDTVLERHDIASGEYILYMGRISSTKGIQYLVEAFRWIKSKTKNRCSRNLKLVIAGTGSYEYALKRQINGLDGVVLTGFVDTFEAKKSIYSNSLAVATSSLYEAFPMVILEAMACSKPVIASCVGDIPMIVENGVNGLLVAPRDVKGLAQSIETLCSNPDLCRDMGSRNRSLVKENYTVEAMAAKTVETYRKLMASKLERKP